MGYLYLAIKIPQLITRAFLLNMATRLKFMLFGLLTRLGLFKSDLHDEDTTSDSNSNSNSVLILDGSSPSLVPIPVHIVTASIKAKVPVVSYGDYLDGLGSGSGSGSETLCTVCLDCVERRHPIRELMNCNHVFHRECLDTWVEQGQVTCPLCRSMLLPPNKLINSYSYSPLH